MAQKKYLHSIIVPQNQKPIFLNRYVQGLFPGISSKGRAKKAMADGEIKVSGQHVPEDYKVRPGDRIELYPPKRQQKKVFLLDLEVVYEDDHLAVVNKPGGLPVNGNSFKTLENALPGNLKPSRAEGVLPYPMPVHRLDVPTCGLVVVAKTFDAQIQLGKFFEEKKIQKVYHAVVIGTPESQSGTIDEPVQRKKSITKFKVIKSTPSDRYGSLSSVELSPITGRTHQLRIHMSEKGHPIVGDEYYSNGQYLLKGKGLFLCAVSISMKHPISSKPLEVKIAPPRKFEKYIERETYFAKSKKKPGKNTRR